MNEDFVANKNLLKTRSGQHPRMPLTKPKGRHGLSLRVKEETKSMFYIFFPLRFYFYLFIYFSDGVMWLGNLSKVCHFIEGLATWAPH